MTPQTLALFSLFCMTLFLSCYVLLLWWCVVLLRRNGSERDTIRKIRQRRREQARTIRVLEQYLAAYVAEVERLKSDAEPRPRYVDAKGELLH